MSTTVTHLTKDALYVPSIVFETGTLSSSNGRITWNGEIFNGENNQKQYDWTPDWKNTIISSGSTYIAPVNGWFVTNGTTSASEININGVQVGKNNVGGDFQILLKKDDEIQLSNSTTFTFTPCRSEPFDTREVKTAYDIWKGAIVEENGSVTVKDLYIPDATLWRTEVREPNNLQITKVVDEIAYNGDTFVCNIQTSEIEMQGTNQEGIFYDSNDTYSLISWDSDLPKLIEGNSMFRGQEALTTFTGNLDNLEDGSHMFRGCRNLNNLNTSLPNLKIGKDMFNSTALTNWDIDLPNLIIGEGMFRTCSFTHFESDLSNLVVASVEDGYEMFTSLTSFRSNLTSLKSGYDLFAGCKLDKESINHIAENINDISSLVKSNDSDWQLNFTLSNGQQYNLIIPSNIRGRIDIGTNISESNYLSAFRIMEEKGWTIYVNGLLWFEF